MAREFALSDPLFYKKERGEADQNWLETLRMTGSLSPAAGKAVLARGSNIVEGQLQIKWAG